jgi:hypothetical protein
MAKVKGVDKMVSTRKMVTSIGGSTNTNPKNKNKKVRFKRSRGQG